MRMNAPRCTCVTISVNSLVSEVHELEVCSPPIAVSADDQGEPANRFDQMTLFDVGGRGWVMFEMGLQQWTYMLR